MGTCGPWGVQACPGHMAGGCVGWEGAGRAPVSVAPQDSLDADGSLVQGLAPLYRQQGFLVFLGWERSHHAAAPPHRHSPTCSQKSGSLRLFPHCSQGGGQGKGPSCCHRCGSEQRTAATCPAPIQELPILALSSC